MEDVLVTIVKKPLRIDWLEMTVRLQIALSIFNRDRLDPVNRVLQEKCAGSGRQLDYNFMRPHRIRWRRADVQKKRSVRSEKSSNLCCPLAAPSQIRLATLAVGIFSVADSQVVWRGGYHKINTFIWQTRHSLDAILPAKFELSH